MMTTRGTTSLTGIDSSTSPAEPTMVPLNDAVLLFAILQVTALRVFARVSNVCNCDLVSELIRCSGMLNPSQADYWTKSPCKHEFCKLYANATIVAIVFATFSVQCLFNVHCLAHIHTELHPESSPSFIGADGKYCTFLLNIDSK